MGVVLLSQIRMLVCFFPLVCGKKKHGDVSGVGSKCMKSNQAE